jgi:prolyl-tRNA synthetase
MLRDKPEDAKILEFGVALARDLCAQSVFGAPLRVLFDTRPQKSTEKRWNWVRRGAPVIIEIGPRDVDGGNVSFMRRDALRDGDKVKSQVMARDAFVAGASKLLSEIQNELYAEAKARLTGNIKTGIDSFAALEGYFGSGADDENAGEFKGWVRAAWSRPSGAALDAIDTKLKALKLTLRNAPGDQPTTFGKCIFTGEPGVEEILIARAY